MALEFDDYEIEEFFVEIIKKKTILRRKSNDAEQEK